MDVSKQTLDFALLNEDGKLVMQSQIENSAKAIERLIGQLPETEPHGLRICMEHTCIYNHYLLDTFAESTYGVWLESGKQIRYSIGLQRSKTDAVVP